MHDWSLRRPLLGRDWSPGRVPAGQATICLEQERLGTTLASTSQEPGVNRRTAAAPKSSNHQPQTIESAGTMRGGEHLNLWCLCGGGFALE